MIFHQQFTMMVVERAEARHFTGLLDKNGQPIVAREVRDPIGFYPLHELAETDDGR